MQWGEIKKDTLHDANSAEMPRDIIQTSTLHGSKVLQLVNKNPFVALSMK